MKKNIKLWIFCALMTFLLVGSWCFGSAAQASVQQDFINNLSPDVIKVAHKYNLYPSVMMAQAALESDFGQSSLSQDANNYFGVKGSYDGQSVQVPTMEYDQNGQPYYVNDSFRKYPNPEASIEDNAKLIRYGIYGDPAYYSGAWRENATDGVNAANSLGGKYATDPSYANNLVDIIQQYNLNSLLDNAWKRIHINKLKKQARQFINKLRRYRQRYAQSAKRIKQYKRINRRNHRAVVAKVTRAKSKVANQYKADIVKYKGLYKNNQAELSRNYKAFKVYDHLNQEALDNWKRLGAQEGKHVYIDMTGLRKGHRYYRIRFKPSDWRMYWVRGEALNFVKPTYYYHPYTINSQQLDVSRAYNQILGTSPTVRVVKGKIRKPMYRSNWFAIIPHNTHPTWYQIKNDEGRTVWVPGNPNRPTQYLYYNENKTLNRYYRSAPLQNHAADAAYRKVMQRYSWSQVKPRRNRVNINCVAINTRRNNQFWYRINNNHHWYWTNLTAFKG